MTYWLSPEPRRRRILKTVREPTRVPLFVAAVGAALALAVSIVLYQGRYYLKSTALLHVDGKDFGPNAICTKDDGCHAGHKYYNLWVGYTIVLGLSCAQFVLAIASCCTIKNSFFIGLVVTTGSAVMSALTTASAVVAVVVALHPLRHRHHNDAAGTKLGYILCWVIVGGCAWTLLWQLAAVGAMLRRRLGLRKWEDVYSHEEESLGKSSYTYTNETIGFAYHN